MNERTFFKQECFTHFPGVGVWYSNMKAVYMCHGGFKNRGLKERPLTGNEELSELAHT